MRNKSSVFICNPEVWLVCARTWSSLRLRIAPKDTKCNFLNAAFRCSTWSSFALITVPKQRCVAVSAPRTRLTPIIKVCPFVCVPLYWFGSDKPRPSLCAAPQERECTGEHAEVWLGCGFHQRPPDFPSGGTQVLCPARGLVNCPWKLASLKAFFWNATFFL